MKILAFAGSNSKTSINKQLLNYTLNQIENAEIDFLSSTNKCNSNKIIGG